MPETPSVQIVNVQPKPRVTIYLPGGTHGFDAKMAKKRGGVPMRADHAAALTDHLLAAATKSSGK